MIKILPRQIEALQKAGKKPVAEIAKLVRSAASELSSSVDFEYNEEEGRFAVAKSNIQIGEKILSEEPHCVMLLEKFSKSHCQHCFKRYRKIIIFQLLLITYSNYFRTLAPLACPTCSHVVFCSVSCRQTALAGYHKYECGILKDLWDSGSSITCHMALRMISQKSNSYFQEMRPLLEKGVTFEKTTG